MLASLKNTTLKLNRTGTRKKQTSETTAERKPRPFGEGIKNEAGELLNYHGPSDGRSNPDPTLKAVMQPAVDRLVDIFYRTKIEGEENLPSDGHHVYAPTHMNILDPAITARVLPAKTRYLADIGLFKTKIGAKVLTAGGAFPVFRPKPAMATVRHMVESVKNGDGLCIFPEGGMVTPHREGKIGALKKGAAFSAVHGEADTIVPIALAYLPNTEKREKAHAINNVVAGLTMAAGLAGAFLPEASGTAAALMGGVGGAYLGGKALNAAAPDKKWFNKAPKMMGLLAGGVLGAAAGSAITSNLSAAVPGPAGTALSVALGLAGGMAAKAIGESFVNRDVAHVKIGEPIKIPEFVSEHGKKDSIEPLTVELHRRLGSLTEDLTGVPYDDTEEKFLQGYVTHAELEH